MSSILKDERILLRKINRSRVSRLEAGYKVSTFSSFSNNFFSTHSQVDRCRDVKLILAGKGVGETLNILVHRRSGRSRTATIYHSSPPDGKTYSLPPFSLTTLVSRHEKRATRIDPSVARDELPANAPPKQIFAPGKETFHLSRCRRFLNVSPNAPTCRYSKPSIPISLPISRLTTD